MTRKGRIQNAERRIETAWRSSGFTLIEMLTTVAVLIILLGLMVSLARDVRNKSANQLTSNLFRQLDDALHRYEAGNGGQLPEVTPLIVDNAPVPDEITLHRVARRNNEDFVRALRKYFARTRPSTQAFGTQAAGDALKKNEPFMDHAADAEDSYGGEEFGDLPTSIYDEITLRDAWGDPIVFMTHDHPAIGMASRASPSFFFSAGPDHRYLTRNDNLYSYEANRAE